MLGNPPVRHWVLVVSLDSRNTSERVDSVLIVPFGSQGADAPTTLRFEPGETGLPGPSWLKGHFITTINKSLLGERLPRPLAALRMRQASLAIQRAFDPDSPPRKA
jgi:mRNA-degrading endonuclease toxin of MazEF toxin-antitoxin module